MKLAKAWLVGSLARRLILLLAFVAIAPLVVAMTLSAVTFTRAQSDEIVRRQAEVAKGTAGTIEAILKTPKEQLSLLSGIGNFSSENGRVAVATHLFKANEGIDRVIVVGADGRELTRRDRYEVFGEADLRDMRGSQLFQASQSLEVYVGPVTFSRFNEPVVLIGVPLVDERDQVQGALAAHFNLKVMWDLLAQADAGETGYAYVIDSDGRLIGHQDPSVVLSGLDISSSESVLHIFGGDGQQTPMPMPKMDHGTTLEGLWGQRVLLSHSPIRDTGWIAVVETPTTEAFAGQRGSITNASLVALACLLGAVIFAIVVGRRFVKRILLLTTTARQISAGNLSPQVEEHGTDEVGQLAESFRVMVDKLKKAFGDLEGTVAELREREGQLNRLNDTLEERVAERTLQLSKTNADLEGEINERKQAQRELVLKAEELARSNSELEQFAYVASHDLQEPLRKVQSFGDLLTSRSGEALNEQGRGYLQRMKDAAARMQTLIVDLLSYSRITSQAQPFVPVHLAELTQEVVSDLEIRIESTGGRVEVGDLPTIAADPTQMRQLMQNLIGNGLKFHRSEEPPIVRVRGRVLDGKVDGLNRDSSLDEVCELTIEDSGIGFEEKYLDRIFTIFQRLHGRSVYEGTGIGLATCRKIVEQHRGSITAKSTPGEGATFIVTLPVNRARRGHVQWMETANQSPS